jgi:hypothetical protein
VAGVRTIAALYVQRGGSYYGLDGVDPWDEERDARLYSGPHPVVAHPPCARWCMMAAIVQCVHGYRIGDDAGCFAAALESVRRWGGVLEHPAYSRAWRAHDLLPPNPGGGWTVADFSGGWTCHVEQGHYGNLSKKPTWLYACRAKLPRLKWGSCGEKEYYAGMGTRKDRLLHKERGTRRKTLQSLSRLGGSEGNFASKTPTEFRDILIAMARSARPA